MWFAWLLCSLFARLGSRKRTQACLDPECICFYEPGLCSSEQRGPCSCCGPQKPARILRAPYPEPDPNHAKAPRDSRPPVKPFVTSISNSNFFVGDTAAGEEKRLWVAFSKPKETRLNGGHAALVRRAVRQLVPAMQSKLETEYNTGTVWLKKWLQPRMRQREIIRTLAGSLATPPGELPDTPRGKILFFGAISYLEPITTHQATTTHSQRRAVEGIHRPNHVIHPVHIAHSTHP